MSKFDSTLNAIFKGVLMCTMIVSAIVVGPMTALAAEPTAQPVKITVTHEQKALPVSVTRSWYGDSLALETRFQLGPHYFSGNNIGIEMTASCPNGGTFSVALYRGSSYIGAATFNRNGFNRATWENVGSGSYKFVFTKSGSGIITSNDVAMFSW